MVRYEEHDTNIPYSKLKVCYECTNKKGTYLIQQRDKNAALNILFKFKHFLQFGYYPKQFTRNTDI